MAKEESIFDVAGQSAKKKEAPKPTQETRKTVEEYRKTSALPADLNEAYKKCQEMSKKLSEDLENIYKRAKISPKQLHEYLDTQHNFSDKDWKAMRAKRLEVKKKLEELMYKANIKPREAPQEEQAKEAAVKEEPSKEEKQKEEGKPEEKKKLKTGVRRQRWMPMH